MDLVAVSLATGLALAGVVLQRRGRPGVAVVALLLPAVLLAPGVVARDVATVRAERSLRPSQAALVVPGPLRRFQNTALALGARRLVPRGAAYRFVLGGAYLRGGVVARRARYVNTTDWLQSFLAPRVPVAGRARWDIVLGARPRAVGLRARRAWRFGRDWLVRT